MSRFGSLLTEIRSAKDWTQARLAREARLDQSFVSRLESGDRAPERDTLLRIIDALGVTPYDQERLFAAAGYRSPALDDPLVSELVRLLIDPSLPADVDRDLRTLIRVAVLHAQRELERRGDD
jgi:transcriptional regulator with XRE-family HTH domain